MWKRTSLSAMVLSIVVLLACQTASALGDANSDGTYSCSEQLADVSSHAGGDPIDEDDLEWMWDFGYDLAHQGIPIFMGCCCFRNTFSGPNQPTYRELGSCSCEDWDSANCKLLEKTMFLTLTVTALPDKKNPLLGITANGTYDFYEDADPFPVRWQQVVCKCVSGSASEECALTEIHPTRWSRSFGCDDC